MTRPVRTTASALTLRSAPHITATTDTGKRLMSGQSAMAVGETFDGQWLFVEAPAGDGWASAQYLEPAGVALPAPLLSTRSVRTTASALTLRLSPHVVPATDTGKRLTLGNIATAAGATFDGQWLFVEASAGNGWASAQYLESATVAPPQPTALHYTLEGEDPELTTAIARLREAAEPEGIAFDTADFGGVRTEADTIKILKYRDNDYAVYVRNLKAKSPNATPISKEIWRPIAPFGSSMHNFGCARDLKITKRPSSFSEAETYRRLGVLAPSCGLRWGGTFTKKVDPPHFELPITLAAARQR